jgi:hypothetical protein
MVIDILMENSMWTNLLILTAPIWLMGVALIVAGEW